MHNTFETVTKIALGLIIKSLHIYILIIQFNSIKFIYLFDWLINSIKWYNENNGNTFAKSVSSKLKFTLSQC